MTEHLFILALPQPHVTFLVALLSCYFTQRRLTHPQIGIKGQDLRSWASSQTFLGYPIKPPPPSSPPPSLRAKGISHLQGLLLSV